MIDPSRLEKYSRGDLKTAASGIYFLYRKEKLTYIGQSKNLETRVRFHPKEYDKFSFIEAKIESLNKLERQYIKAFLPGENSHKFTDSDIVFFGVNINGPSARLFNKIRFKRSGKEGEITKSQALNEAVDLWNEKYGAKK